MTTAFATRFGRYAARRINRGFGDSITYHPTSNVNDDRIVKAVIERDVQVLASTGEVTVYDIVCEVLDDASEGIAATEIDTGPDQVTVPLRVGETGVRRQIVKVLSTENGLVRFAVQ